MTDDDFYKDGYEDWHKNENSDVIWWTAPIDQKGNILFTFDKKTVFDFYSDYPDKLTAEQIKIFKKENPTLAELKPAPED